MDDSISRQAAIDALKSAKGKDPFGRYDLQNIGLDWGVSAIEKLPLIQPKRGRWITGKDNQGMYHQCSECGGILTRISCFEREFNLFPSHNSIAKTNFCPSCGADMRGGEDAIHE